MEVELKKSNEKLFQKRNRKHETLKIVGNGLLKLLRSLIEHLLNGNQVLIRKIAIDFLYWLGRFKGLICGGF